MGLGRLLISKRSGSFRTGFDGGIDSTSDCAFDGRIGVTCDGANLRYRTDGIAVDLVGQALESEHPVKHAMELLRALMRDEAFAGQLATEKPLRKFYTAICRSQGIKPFPWPSVFRHVNGMLKAVYGRRTKNLQTRVCGLPLRNRRVYRIPLA